MLELKYIIGIVFDKGWLGVSEAFQTVWRDKGITLPCPAARINTERHGSHI